MRNETESAIVSRWTKDVSALLVGRTIKSVRYMDMKEKDDLGWMSRAVVLELDNGLLLYPSQDDEGNDAGAIFTTSKKLPTIPVI